MALITGDITVHGAVISLLVGVSRNRQAVLEKHGLPVPAPVAVRAQIDTGSFITGFTTAVFEQLDIGHIRVVRVRTPSTSPDQPYMARVYDVVLALVTGTDRTALPVHAIASDDFDRERDGDVHGIIGRDILEKCTLHYLGLDRRFTLAY